MFRARVFLIGWFALVPATALPAPSDVEVAARLSSELAAYELIVPDLADATERAVRLVAQFRGDARPINARAPFRRDAVNVFVIAAVPRERRARPSPPICALCSMQHEGDAPLYLPT